MEWMCNFQVRLDERDRRSCVKEIEVLWIWSLPCGFTLTMHMSLLKAIDEENPRVSCLVPAMLFMRVCYEVLCAVLEYYFATKVIRSLKLFSNIAI